MYELRSSQTFIVFLLQHRERLQTSSAHTCYTLHCLLTLMNWTNTELVITYHGENTLLHQANPSRLQEMRSPVDKHLTSEM